MAAKKEEKKFKVIFVENATRAETVLRVGSYAEAQAALSIAETEAKAGKYDLTKGHFAMLNADPRLEDFTPAKEAKQDKKRETKTENE